MEAPSWYSILSLWHRQNGTNPWKSQCFGMLASFPGVGEPAWRGMLCGAHPQVLQHPALLLPGQGAWNVGMAWSSPAQGRQAPSLMHLSIAVYTSGCNLEITLPESIKDLTGNTGISSS